jgi:hypothetical protein
MDRGQATTFLCENIREGKIKPSDVDFCHLGQAMYGFEDWHDAIDRPGGFARMMEAVDGIHSTMFLDITQRVLSAATLEDFDKETALASSLISLTPNVTVKNERQPGIGNFATEGTVVPEGTTYPTHGFSDNYQDFGDGDKRGFISAVTRETLHFTGYSSQIIARARSLGERLMINKERRIWNMIFAIGADFNPYSYNGTNYNTYQNAAAAAPWTNMHVNQLQDWTDIDAAERLWDDMTDPDTGDPIVIGGTTLLVMPAQWMTARRILTATEIRSTPDAQTIIGSNPIQGTNLAPKSLFARQVLGAGGLGIDTPTLDYVWLYGDFKRAFTYRENWPMTVVQEPPNAAAEFEQDIVFRWKVTERGHPTVMQPRYMLITSSAEDHSSSGLFDEVVDPGPWPGNQADWS